MTMNAPQVVVMEESPTYANWKPFAEEVAGHPLKKNVVLECGWGRLLFGHTFADARSLTEALRAEAPNRRDIALYIRDPHIVLALAPQEVFLDPSHTYRLDLSGMALDAAAPSGLSIARPDRLRTAQAMSQVCERCKMVPTPPEFVIQHLDDPTLVFLTATDSTTGAVLGCVTGVDHVAAFDDPERGSSLWSLAVDPQARHPGVGAALVTQLARTFQERGRTFMDLSVMYDNTHAIALYESIGFKRIPAFCIKRKNPINEPLFVADNDDDRLNPYAGILVAEARRRGIAVDILDAEEGYFRLTFGGRSIACRESLSELTSAVAMSRCDNKRVTRRILTRAGLEMPAQQLATDGEEDIAFLSEHGRIVVKPESGEQGQGVFVGLSSEAEMREAIRNARAFSANVLLEAFVEGQDLRIVVINDVAVAAAIRRPAEVVGTGRHSVRTLIEKQSRRRAAATGGESTIPLDEETERCVASAGFDLEDIPPQGKIVRVRRSANLHTGGTIHDVTDQLHPALADAAVRAAKALDIPVVGMDFIVPDATEAAYAIIEANERPGLANHEPQPTAERFIDLLFPTSGRVE